MSTVPGTIRTFARAFGCAAAATLAALIISAATTAPTASALPPGGAKTQPRGAKVKLHSKTVKLGGKLRVSGSNWKAKGSRISGKREVTVKLADGAILGVFPIKKKRFKGSVRIPSRIKPGRYWLRFLASEPRTSVKSRSFRVTR